MNETLSSRSNGIKGWKRYDCQWIFRFVHRRTEERLWDTCNFDPNGGRAINIEPRLNQRRRARINVNFIHFIRDSSASTCKISCNIRVTDFAASVWPTTSSKNTSRRFSFPFFFFLFFFFSFPSLTLVRLVYLWLECEMNGALDVNLFAVRGVQFRAYARIKRSRL